MQRTALKRHGVRFTVAEFITDEIDFTAYLKETDAKTPAEKPERVDPKKYFK